MIIRRLTLTLPARLRPAAAQDARTIAEAVARALPEAASARPDTLRVVVEGRGQSAAALAAAAAAGLAGGGRHGR